jgi:hypothetical protein
MREFSKVSPAVWRSSRFTSLETEPKLLYLYLLTCTHLNSAGCFHLPDAYASADLGWEPERYTQNRKTLIEKELIRFDDETIEVMIERWFQHNPPMNPKHRLGIEKALNKISSDELASAAKEAMNTALNPKCKDSTGTSLPEHLNTAFMRNGGSR